MAHPLLNGAGTVRFSGMLLALAILSLGALQHVTAADDGPGGATESQTVSPAVSGPSRCCLVAERFGLGPSSSGGLPFALVDTRGVELVKDGPFTRASMCTCGAPGGRFVYRVICSVHTWLCVCARACYRNWQPAQLLKICNERVVCMLRGRGWKRSVGRMHRKQPLYEHQCWRGAHRV